MSHNAFEQPEGAMPIPFTCPYCGLQSNVADQFAGQSGPCSRCGNTINVPGGAAGPGGVVPAPSTMAVETPRKSNALMVIVILAVVGIGAVCVIAMLAALLLPAIQAARTAAQVSMCANNMKQIGIAMHNYHDTYGSFPPAYVADETGQPMHSWRVLLLPFIEGGDMLYEQYNFDEPWDSPNNSSLSFMMPMVYRCPESFDTMDETSYVVINGPGFIFDGESTSTMRDIIDGTSNTIMVVEADATPVQWMAPHDVDWNATGIDIRSSHMGQIHALYADASVNVIDDVADQDLEASLTTGGGEPIDIRQ
jgi:hypothetical protein